MQSSPTILFAIACGFFALLLVMVAIAVFVIRKGNAKKEKVTKSLGLAPVTDTQPLLQRVAYVNGINRPELYRLEQVYQRHASSGGDVYMFGLNRRDIKAPTATTNSHSSEIHYHPLETDALAFVLPAWHLPRFQAMPRLNGKGKLAALTNKAAESAADINMEVVKFQHIPNLDDRYLIATAETPASEVNPPDEFLRALASSPNLRLHAGGDTLTISYANSASQPPNEEGMKTLYKIGIQLAKDIQAM